MDFKELDSRIKAVQKAVSNKEPDANIIVIMETLKKDVNATEELLRSTKAGMVIAKQRGNTNKDIGRLATEIVTKWKKQVEAEKVRKSKLSGASPVVKSGNTSSPAPQTSRKASPQVPSSETKGFTGDPAKRKWETDKVDIKRTGIPSRDNCIGLLYNGLAFMSEETPTAVILRAIQVEAAAYKAFNGENDTYKGKLRSLFQNLKQPKNRELGLHVMSGEITPERFVVMTHEELKSAERRKEDEKLNVENSRMAQVPQAEKAVSSEFKCSKCGEKKVSYTQAQTRSADEPMTTFCECLSCGKRWKFS